MPIRSTVEADAQEVDMGDAQRVAELHEYGLLDAPVDDELEAVVRMAAAAAGVATATLNLIDAHRQCQLTSVGFDGADTPRRDSMCAVRFRQGRTVWTSDASVHPDYATNLNNQAELRSRCGDNAGAERLLRQVVAELKKVVRPTRTELLTYTAVVLVFVLAVMTYVSLLDYGFGKLVLWVFGGS